MAVITSNSEILFIYDAKMTNPNGDMDNENKPRMDYDTDTNLVSDVRLKRYLRDYFEKQLGESIFVTENAKDAKDRGAQLKKEGRSHKDLMDCRMFGAVFAETGGSDHLTGPIQFNWGYSLNRVELCESNTITSSFSSGEGVGKDFRVKYSVIAFSGAVNARTAEGTGLSHEDMSVFDKAMINAIPFCRTRSKIGQTPRLYLRVEMGDHRTFLKDLREYVSLESDDDLRDIRGLTLAMTELAAYLKQAGDQIGTIHFWKDDQLRVEGWDALEAAFQGRLSKINPLET